MSDYSAKTEAAGTASILENYEIRFSIKTGLYHIFFLTQPFGSLKSIVSDKKMTVRECLQLLVSIGKDISQWHKLDLSYDNLADNTVYIIDKEGKSLTPVLGFPGSTELYRVCGLHSASSTYREHFQDPEGITGTSNDIYGVAMLLYKMLNNYQFPFISLYEDNALAAFKDAEEKRKAGLVPQPPYFADNAVGRAVAKGLMKKNQRFRTMDEVCRILENSLNYLTPAELDVVAIDIERIRGGLKGTGSPTALKREFSEIMPQKAQNQSVKVSRSLEQEDKSERTNKGLKIALISTAIIAVILLLLYLMETKHRAKFAVADTAGAESNKYVMHVSAEDWNANYFN